MKVKIELKGVAALRLKLQEMPAAASGDILLRMVKAAAEPIRSAAASLAPKDTGALRGGIQIELLKSGSGFAYVAIAPDEDTYYALFHEYGLGTGRSQPLTAKVLRRRENYDNSVRIRRKIMAKVVRGDSSFDAEYLMLNKREAKRQKILAAGKHLQGERRPNMAAHPFMRPAVQWKGAWFFAIMKSRLEDLIRKFEERG